MRAFAKLRTMIDRPKSSTGLGVPSGKNTGYPHGEQTTIRESGICFRTLAVKLATATYFERNRVVVAPLCFAGFKIETPDSFVILLAGVKINEPAIDNWRTVAVADVNLPILLQLLGPFFWRLKIGDPAIALGTQPSWPNDVCLGSQRG